MQFTKTDIDGLLIIEPKVFGDERGYFYESFHQERFNRQIGKDVCFLQDNESMSSKGIIRGLHFQKPPYAQGKLVRVIQGSVLDVAVDIRKNSKTYGKHVTIELSGENKKMFWIPEGFAHGFLSLEDNTIFSYKCTNYYHKESEGCLLWKDESLAIDWGVENPIVSEKDIVGESLKSFNSPF